MCDYIICQAITELQETVDAYPIFLKECLNTELRVLYERLQFKNLSGHTKNYDITYTTGMCKSLVEVFKLIK